MAPTTVPVPRGFTRHPASGCIVPDAELEAHELALAAKAARRSVVPLAAASSAELELEREKTRRVEMELRLEELKAARASQPAPVSQEG